jgi:hypothetical protein
MRQYFQLAGTAAQFTISSGLKCKTIRNYGFLGFIFQLENLVDLVHGGCTVDREWAHSGGSSERDRPGARAHRSSPAVAIDEDGDEAKPRGCSPEHVQWSRVGAMTAERRRGSGGGQEKAQKRGEEVRFSPGARSSFYRVRGGGGRAVMEDNGR